MTVSQRNEYETPAARHDFSDILSDAIATLYWNVLKASNDGDHKAQRQMDRTTRSLETLFSCYTRVPSVDDHLAIAANDLSGLGRMLDEKNHKLADIGSRIQHELAVAKAARDTTYFSTAPCGTDYRGRPYGMPGVACFELSKETRQLLYSTKECIEALNLNKHYEPKPEDLSIVNTKLRLA